VLGFQFAEPLRQKVTVGLSEGDTYSVPFAAFGLVHRKAGNEVAAAESSS